MGKRYKAAVFDVVDEIVKVTLGFRPEHVRDQIDPDHHHMLHQRVVIQRNDVRMCWDAVQSMSLANKPEVVPSLRFDLRKCGVVLQKVCVLLQVDPRAGA